MLSHGGVLVVILFSLIAPSIAEEAPKVVAGANSGGCLANYKLAYLRVRSAILKWIMS